MKMDNEYFTLTKLKEHKMNSMDGDLIELALKGEFEVIVHGCNCFHSFGAGIAKQIKNVFPEAYKQDKLTIYGSRVKMGKTSSITVKGVRIVNAYTQYKPGKMNQLVLEKNIAECFKEIKRLHRGKRIGIPKIGAGLAGGDWNTIKNIIETIMDGEDITVVNFVDQKQLSFKF